MSEKTGNTEKMRYDFETAADLQVFLPIKADWYRVTSRQFRSWTGKRRINEVDYNGPVYLYGMNKRVNRTTAVKDIIIGYNNNHNDLSVRQFDRKR
tara:strand:+ start:487 stop:774 length:288 start_codon:yes stop_codon:yes gene_type:complete